MRSAAARSFFAIAPPVRRRWLRSFVPAEFTRILSDIHFGDRATRVTRLAQLRPLLAGVDRLLLNGDTLDTRPGPSPALTAESRAEVLDFFACNAPHTTFITGNHDADVSPHHWADLAAGEVFALHGDILFETMVPWGADAPLIARLIREEFCRLPPELHHQLEHRLGVFRRVAAVIPQRHQAERHPLKYAIRYLADTVWPPARVFRVINAWKTMPRHAHALLREHRPAARFLIAGHTHRPGIWTHAAGTVVINTGSFCRPLGGYAVDLHAGRLGVRRIESRRGEFHPGAVVAEFPLARG